MFNAICDTSPLLFLFRIGKINWFPEIFNEFWTSNAVLYELEKAQIQGYNVPNLKSYDWLKIKEPRFTPSEWLALDLGAGELSVMSLALEHPKFIVILDDALARRTATAAGLEVWGSLRIMLEAKQIGLTDKIEPLIDSLENAGLWISKEIKRRILTMAKEL